MARQYYCYDQNSCWVLLIVALLFGDLQKLNCQQLKMSFYTKTCPRGESIVKDAVSFAIFNDPSIAGGLLRMHFHDCFTQGCDGSILLDSVNGTQAEKDAPPNKSLRGYEVIDTAKHRVEAECPGVMSCADILAFAARDSVVQMGGQSWSVPAGRRDGFSSRGNDAIVNLPSFSASVGQLAQSFQVKGITQSEMVTLSGAHTLGDASCSSFSDRLYKFNNTVAQDPSLDPQYAQILKDACPISSNNPNSVHLDVSTPNIFDNAFYENLMSGKGLLQTDQLLSTDSRTKGYVRQLARSNVVFLSKFAKAMVKMGNIGLLTGLQGQVRKDCRIVNS